jgi:iron complex transport system ATP-binding protein
MTKELLKFDNVSYTNGKREIVSDINWTISKGENWIILGPNGAGKTTLLKLIYGQVWPNASGTVYRKGQKVLNLGLLRQSIGLVSPDLKEFIPKKENVLETVISGKYAMLGFWSRSGIAPKDKKNASQILEKLNIYSFINRNTRSLSTGEIQKVLLARSLMSSPYLILLDEPLIGLDPGAQEKFLDTLNTYIKAHDTPTFVYITHHINEIIEGFKKMILIKNGRICYNGSIKKGLSSDNISTLYDFPFDLIHTNNRYYIEKK